MFRFKPKIFLKFFVALLAALAAAGCGSSGLESRSLVKKVDHITISCADPAALFETFTQTLGLPLAWPLSSYPGFTTGGVYCGNVNIETLRFGDAGRETGGSSESTFIYGIVLESYPLSEVMDDFRQRGADPGDPQDQMREIDGQQVKVWTNVTLNGLCTDNYIVYLCEYTEVMKEVLEKRARDNPVPLGGIGLMGVKEIILASTQSGQTRDLWETVFAPAVMSIDGELNFGSGPSILISNGSKNVIEGLILEVDSLQAAKGFLAQNGLLGEASDREISIDPAKVQSLDIRLVERQR